jgi:hypothetical protein
MEQGPNDWLLVSHFTAYTLQHVCLCENQGRTSVWSIGIIFLPTDYAWHGCLRQVLSLYKKHVDPDFTWANFTVEEQAKIIAGSSTQSMQVWYRVGHGIIQEPITMYQL